MAQERNLLFGVLAVQLKLASPQQLVSAAAVWAAQQELDLGAILVEQGVLREADRALIAQLIARQLEAYADNESQVYELFGGDAAVQESFCGSIVFDAAAKSVHYAPLGGDTPAKLEPELQHLSDAEHLTTEHPGRYSLRGEKGRGGIGRVLIAFDEHIGREIALKELLPDSASHTAPAAQSPMRQSATLTARFLREARITGQLEHPGIVPVYEVGRHGDGTLYYTMKLVRGQTMAERLKRCKGIADRLALLPHFLDLCQAIAYAHSRGVIHRDIKPANVMLGEFGETVLLDWGLAKVRGMADEGAEKLADEVRLLKEAGAEETVAGKPIGTPSYMSPEQADGRIEDIDERSDVWSLGAVLYEILTGQPPYTGATALEVVGKVLSEPVKPVLETQKDAPGELSAVAMRCLNKEHGKRYQSVSVLAGDVAAFTTGGMVSAFNYSIGVILTRWLNRNWPIAATIALSFLLLAVAVPLLWTDRAVLYRINGQLIANLISTESQRQLEQYGKSELSALLSIQGYNYMKRARVSANAVDTACRAVAECYPTSRLLKFNTDNPQPTPLVTFLPNGKRVIARQGCSIISRDLNTLDPDLKVYTDSDLQFSKFAVSVDGQYLAAPGRHQVQLWNLNNMEYNLMPNPTNSTFSDVAFSTDEKCLMACSTEGYIYGWSLAKPYKILFKVIITEQQLTCINVNNDYNLIACGTNNGKLVIIKSQYPYNIISSIQVFPTAIEDLLFIDDKHIIVAGPSSIAIVIVQNENLIIAEKYECWGTLSIALSPDRSKFACAGFEQVVQLWNVNDNLLKNPPQILRGHIDTITSLAFSPDNKYMISAGYDCAYLYDLKPSYTEPVSINVGSITSMEYLADRSKVVCMSRGTLLYFDSKYPYRILDGNEIYTSNKSANYCLSCDPNTNNIAVGLENGLIKIYDGNNLSSVPSEILASRRWINVVAYSIERNILATGDSFGKLCLWDIDSSRSSIMWSYQCPDSEKLDKSTLSLCYTSDGKQLAVYFCNTESILVFDTRLGTLLHQYPVDDSVFTMRYSKNGKYLAYGGRSAEVYLLSLDKTNSRPKVLKSHEGCILTLQFDDTSSYLVSGGGDRFCGMKDYAVRLWKVEDPKSPIAVLNGLHSNVVGLLFDNTNKKVIAGSENGQIKIWTWSLDDIVKIVNKIPWRNLTVEEWNQFVGKENNYESTIPWLPPGEGAPGAQKDTAAK